MARTIGELTAAIREINVEKGWRPAGGGPFEGQYWGDYVALLHSEISEALEAYRDHRMEDATAGERWTPDFGALAEPADVPKPEGVGAELADVFIRLVDMCDVFGQKLEPDFEIEDIQGLELPAGSRGPTFGELVCWLHVKASLMVQMRGADGVPASVTMLRTLVTVSRHLGIDLDAEVKRKIAFNRTRAFQHGGRSLAGPKPLLLEKLKQAMPDDPRGWWTGEEVGEFASAWTRLGLPALTMSDGNGESVTFWTKDLAATGRLLGVGLNGTENVGIEIEQGEYTAWIVQAEK